MTRNRKYIISSIFLFGILSISYFFFSKKKESQIESRHYFHLIHITEFTRAELPLIPVQIENKTFNLGLDLGCRKIAGLSDSILKDIQEKKYLCTNTIYGFRGKAYEEKVYTISAIQIPPFTLRDINVHEESSEFIKDSEVFSTTSSPTSYGCIGWGFFKNFNLFLDLSHAKVAFCDSLETLKNEGYSNTTFIKLPLILDHSFLELEMETKEGPWHIMLDTGSTTNVVNAIHKEPEEEKAFLEPGWKPYRGDMNLTLNGFELTPMPVYAIPIHYPCKIDMVLGVPFFKTHLVFFDFTENCVYISKANSLE